MIWDEIKIYLPKFLSAESEKELFEGLKDFPSNYTDRFYSNPLNFDNRILQGDGMLDLPIIKLPEGKVQEAKCMIFSNTCDIDPENLRLYPSQIVYAPIFNLEKYRQMLFRKGNRTEQQISSHLDAIKEQKISQILYLPAIKGVINESIVFFDRVQNIPVRIIMHESLKKRKLFTLSNLGFYLFLVKLSIHFTRIRDNIDRNI